MSDPQTTNILLSIPTRGSDVGTWDTPVNGDFNSIDGRFGGVQSIAVSSSPVTLTSPSGSPTPAGGPTQAENAVLKISGTLTADVSITLPLPGYYVIDTTSVAGGAPGGFVLAFRGITATEFIAMQAGTIRHIYNDGANVRFVNLAEVGSYMDFATTSVPRWISFCSKPPFLLCDGSSFSGVTYPALAGFLGGTTLPDFRGRKPHFYNGGTGRLTSAGAGIDGNTLFASGGNNGITLSVGYIPSLTVSGTITVTPQGRLNVPGTNGGISGQFYNNGSGPTGNNFPTSTSGGTGDWLAVGFSGNNSMTYTNASPTGIPDLAPGVVSGIRMIRAA